MFRQIYKSLNIPTDEGLINKLSKPVPKANKDEKPKFTAYKRDAVHQMDLLFLPNDNGYKYALAVVDLQSRLADAEPLKSKKPAEVLTALKRIYKRKYLDMPTIMIQLDNGGEFKGVFEKFFDDKVILRKGKPNRHRQQAVVEWMNYLIGKSIFARLNQDEIITGKQSKAWVKLLPKIIDGYNKVRQPQIKDRPNTKTIEDPLAHVNKNVKIYKVGKLVRVPLDYPQDIATGKKLGDKFRASDLRWDVKPRKITNILMAPNQPVMYTVEGIENTAYTFNQLQPVTGKEMEGMARDYFEVEKLTGKKKEKNRIYYKVKWKGYKKQTWEPRSTLIKDVPELIKAYENKNK